MPFLFTYGTLQDLQVQEYVFGRILKGHPDELPHFKRFKNAVYNRYPLVKPSKHSSDTVKGTVYKVTDDELTLCDAYETTAYKRNIFELTSGIKAWVYVDNSR